MSDGTVLFVTDGVEKSNGSSSELGFIIVAERLPLSAQLFRALGDFHICIATVHLALPSARRIHPKEVTQSRRQQYDDDVAITRLLSP